MDERHDQAPELMGAGTKKNAQNGKRIADSAFKKLCGRAGACVRRTMRPATYLAAAFFAASLALNGLYSTSYAVTVDGKPVATVADQSVVQDAIDEVEEEGSSLLGYDYQIKGNLDYQYALTLKSNLDKKEDVEEFFYTQLDDVSAHQQQCEVSINGKAVGVVKDEAILWDVLEEIKAQYTNENTQEIQILDEVTVNYVYALDELLTTDELKAVLQSPGEDGAPILNVQTKEHQVYTEVIPIPVEEKGDASMYIGESKILSQGSEGEKQLEADVVLLNGEEQSRDITSEVVVKEAAATVKAVGTTEKPKTASTGTYAWPIRGIITSNFGGRYIFGSYSSHSGIDINAAYGATICAADGGTVTWAGPKGSYGNLVIITHDNGTQTYYAHNSSFLVSAGEKVYKGQPIAKAGATGRATGPHCHFEVRINGTSVNPLNYLP